MKNKDSDAFFNTLKYRDMEKIRKRATILVCCAILAMFVATLASLFLAFLVSMKPTPVIAFDKEGKRAVFSGDEVVESETSMVRIHRFLSDFIEKFDGVSPNIEENLKEAYNMLTPKFRQILLDKSLHQEKIDMWKNKNFETKFSITTLKIIKGSLKVGSNLTVEGLGEMKFKNVIDYSGEGEQRKDFVWFSALLIVAPVSLKLSPDGLFVEFYAGKNFNDFRELRAYLLENKKEYLLEEDEKEVFE